ncbi:hypothetical protein PIB30_018931 [Stylosanthes scabra]|uniref:Bidirectional sugar transporter SWEET n=1 Tax=Stylosanthes scabra TaxID=79078 RepID=A0ABU6Y8J4_9FABA|nr:hypothetical protein [Stylosanthes scabra]
MWMAYGILLKDIYVTLPNIVGVTFGTIQMVLYLIYRKNKPVAVSKDNEKLPQHNGEVIINDEAAAPQVQAQAQAPIDIEIGGVDQKKKQEEEQPVENNKNVNNPPPAQVQVQQQNM